MIYNHTQFGNLMKFVLVALILYFGIILFYMEFNYIVLIFSILIILLIYSFKSLNVIINDQHLKIKFGYGIFKKKFLLKDIESVKYAKHHWYYGWGIRVWFKPYTWIFNVSGFDTIEIIMKNGKRYRIGTDDPKRLELAILDKIK